MILIHMYMRVKVIIDSQNLVEPEAKIFNHESACWLVSGHLSAKDYPANVEQKLVPLLQASENVSHHKIDLTALLQELAKTGVNDALVEAGSGLVGAFVEQGLLDELVVFVAPKLMGSSARPLMTLPIDTMQSNIQLKLVDSRSVGDDLKLTYQVIK